MAWSSGAVRALASLSEVFSLGKLAEAPNVSNPFGIESARGVLAFGSLFYCSPGARAGPLCSPALPPGRPELWAGSEFASSARAGSHPDLHRATNGHNKIRIIYILWIIVLTCHGCYSGGVCE
jgi:hypothetical protein